MPASSNFATPRRVADGTVLAPFVMPSAADAARWRGTDSRRQLLWPLLALGALVAVSNLLQLDLKLADQLYRWEGQAWTLRHAWVTQQLIHLLGRDFSIAAWLTVLAMWMAACARPGWEPLRRPLLYLLTATALSTLLVAGLKSLSNVDCPWDLVRYGGDRPYIGLFEPRPAGLGRGLCFPAGHAGAGYSWVALYFFLQRMAPRWRWLGLAVGLGLGLLFGISQQLRGAHFLSHDLAALAISWACAVGTLSISGRNTATPARAVTGMTGS